MHCCFSDHFLTLFFTAITRGSSEVLEFQPDKLLLEILHIMKVITGYRTLQLDWAPSEQDTEHRVTGVSE